MTSVVRTGEVRGVLVGINAEEGRRKDIRFMEMLIFLLCDERKRDREFLFYERRGLITRKNDIPILNDDSSRELQIPFNKTEILHAVMIEFGVMMNYDVLYLVL